MANTEVGAAYVTIMPSMKGFQRSVSAGVSSAFSGVKGVITAALPTAAVAALGKAALSSYAQFEQLTGGVDKLFGQASAAVRSYAAQAYKTTGQSANRYMEQVTGFSSSLISSLGGDTSAAADLANTAMVAMADNVNVFGSNMEDVQNAFQGFAKDNYSMLDNLRLGYSGTKEEAQRLVRDASKLTSVQKELGITVDEGSLSFDNMIKAIQVVQTEMGIAGTTMSEAAGTVDGSIAMMRGSWENWLTGLGDEDADMDALTDQLIESVITVGENVIPRMGEIMSALGRTMAEKAPEAASRLGSALVELLPSELQTAFESAVQLWNMGDDLEEKFRLTFSYLKTVVGDELSGLLEGAGIDVGGLTDTLSIVATGAAGLAGAFYTLKGALAISNLVGTLRGGLLAFNGVQTLVTTAQTILNGVMGANPFFLVVAAVGALVAAFATLRATNEGFRNAVTSAWESIRSAAASVWGAVVSLFTVDVPNGITVAAGFFQNLPGQIGTALSDAAGRIGAWVGETASKAVEAGSRFLQGVSDGFGQAVEFVKGIPGKVLSALGNIGSLLFDSGVSLLTGFANGIMSGIGTAVSAVKKGLGKIRSFFPFSPAKRGPFAGRGYTTFSGRALMQGFAAGIKSQGAPLASVVSETLSSARDALASAEPDWRRPRRAGGLGPLRPGAVGWTGSKGQSGTVNNYYIDGIALRAARKDEADMVFEVLRDWEELSKA